MLLDAVGVMPSATYVLAQVDRSQPWGPRNVCWPTHVNNAKTLHAGDWSPTAQCTVCKSFRTKIIGTDTVRGIRWHRCKCGRQFETEMLDVEEYEHRTTAAKVLTYDGITQTIREWASERNMTPDAIRGRIANGWSVEEALNTRTQRHLPRPEKLTFKGITQSIEQWASDLGITSRTIHERILRGMSVQDVLSTSGRLPSHRTVNQTLPKASRQSFDAEL